MHLIAQLFQTPAYNIGCAILLKSQLRMCMNIMSELPGSIYSFLHGCNHRVRNVRDA